MANKGLVAGAPTMAPTTVLLDTNFFLHFKSFEQVDWLDLLHVKDVSILIVPIVLRELDRHKDTHPIRKLRKRAATAIKQLGGLRSAPAIRPGIGVVFHSREPDIDFPSNQLRSDVSDDFMIAHLLCLRRDCPSVPPVLVSNDLGLRMKADSRGFDVVEPPEAWGLPDEPDPPEVKVRELERELQAVRDRSARLVLRFASGTDHQRFTVHEVRELTPVDIQHRIDRLNYPYLELDPRTGIPQGASLLRLGSGLLQLQPEDLSAYNQSLVVFFEEYRQYLNAHNRYEIEEALTIRIVLVVKNEGTSPARDVRASLHFPDGFSVLNEDDLADEPVEPAVPRKPMTALERLGQMATVPPHLFSPHIPSIESIAALQPRNVSRLDIRKTNSHTVEFSVSGLMHTFSEEVPPIYIRWQTFEEVKSFNFQWSMIAENIPKPLDGVLHVIVEAVDQTCGR